MSSSASSLKPSPPPSAPASAAATPPSPPTSSNADSSKPPEKLPTTTTRRLSVSTGAPTHPCSATPNSPPTSSSPGGATAASTTNSPEPRVEKVVWKSALTPARHRQRQKGGEPRMDATTHRPTSVRCGGRWPQATTRTQFLDLDSSVN